MKNYLLTLDDQIAEAAAIGKRFQVPASFKKIKKIVFCGVGGSGISGDILKVLVSGASGVYFKVERFHELPKWADKNTLAIFSSYSGNTAETLNAFGQAVARKVPTLAVTSGGILKQKADKKKVPYILLPPGFPPRCAVGYLTFSLIPVLRKLGCVSVSDRDIAETQQVVGRISETRARKIAKALKERFVRFHGLAFFSDPIVARWRAQFAENAKVLSSHLLIPEMFHNEIEGLEGPAPIRKHTAAVFFKDRRDPNFFERKIKKVQSMMKKAGTPVFEINSEGKSLAARLFSLIALGDWVSYELALLRRVDPLEIKNIQALKGKNL